MLKPHEEILIKGNKLKTDPKHIQLSNTESTTVLLENTLHSGPEVFDAINKYRGSLKYTVSVLSGPAGTAGGKVVDKLIYNQVVSPSLFNPFYSLLVSGVAPNVPLLDTTKNGDSFSAEHSNKDGLKTTGQITMFPTDDCSIKKLVELSKIEHGPLGQARYKYSDFMYCKDLGKVSNNHMITLRKFATPVSDNIFYATTYNDDANFSSAGDVGRLITWFGTDDNKLEDILKYSYKAEFKEFEAKIQELPSQEDDPSRGIIGQFANLFNPAYNESTNKGVSPSSLSFIMATSASDTHYTQAPYANNPAVNGSMYDKNKVYEPKDTLRSTYKYTGELKFEHSFTLTFKYKLRGYDNINAKSAFLDLLGNILSVTYRQGTFWGGEQRIIGSPQNKKGWKKAQSFVNDGLEAGGTFIQTLLNGGNIGDAANTFATAITSGLNSSFGIDFSAILGDPMGALKGLVSKLDKANLGAGLKGVIKNQLGRPAVYAFDSLLTNDAVGLWHVTIGNPLNPIAVMGNLIIDNAEISHSGPLGLDDFPTEITVTIALKHGMPRDSVDIQRMYTQGRNAIYSKIGNTNNYNINKESVTAANTKLAESEAARKVSEKKSEEAENDPKVKKQLQDARTESEQAEQERINKRFLDEAGNKTNMLQLPSVIVTVGDMQKGDLLENVGWIGDNDIERMVLNNLYQLK